MGTIIEIMLEVKNRNIHFFYHKDTDTFDGYPVSSIQLQTLDMNARIPAKDDNNFRFLTYDEIDHKDIMRFYVKECVEDKEIRKQLFDILKRHDFIDAFIERLRILNLYDDFETVCGDVYIQLFFDWAEKNGLKF